jgi:hypothetical protein
VNRLLTRLFAERQQHGRTDLEAVEASLRSALHNAGAAALTELLRYQAPAADQHQVPCPCGQHAQYQGLRSKPVLTVVGPARVERPYYLCLRCHRGQFPADVDLDIVDTESSPGVRRMQALVGQDAPFDHGREQMKRLAGLEVTAKAVERTAEAIGVYIARREQQEIQRAVQLDLPIVAGHPIPILYVPMDGTGVPVVKKETEGRKGKIDGQSAHTREAKLGCVFTQTAWDEKGYAIRDPGSTTYTGAIETAEEFGKRLYLEAWNRGWSRAQRRSSSAMERNGSGIWRTHTFRARFRSSTSTTRASTCGNWRAGYTPIKKPTRKRGSRSIKSVSSTRGRSKSW